MRSSRLGCLKRFLRAVVFLVWGGAMVLPAQEFAAVLSASKAGDTNALERHAASGFDFKTSGPLRSNILELAIRDRHPGFSLRWLMGKGSRVSMDFLWDHGSRTAWFEALNSRVISVKGLEWDAVELPMHHVPPKQTCIVTEIKSANPAKCFLPEKIGDLRVIGIKQPGTAIRLHLPESVVILPEGFADGKDGLSRISLSDRVLEIPERGFIHCRSLEHVVFPMALTNIATAAFRGSGLREVDFSVCSNLKSIGGLAFEDCRNLEKVLLPESLEWLGDGAFSRVSEKFSEVVLGSRIRWIGKGAFSENAGLRSIILKGETPPVLSGTIQGILPKGATVRAPRAAIGEYLRAKGWEGIEIRPY